MSNFPVLALSIPIYPHCMILDQGGLLYVAYHGVHSAFILHITVISGGLTNN